MIKSLPHGGSLLETVEIFKFVHTLSINRYVTGGAIWVKRKPSDAWRNGEMVTEIREITGEEGFSTLTESVESSSTYLNDFWVFEDSLISLKITGIMHIGISGCWNTEDIKMYAN